MGRRYKRRNRYDPKNGYLESYDSRADPEPFRGEENYCPICGRLFGHGHCTPRTLGAIEAANTRSNKGSFMPPKTWSERLQEGCNMLDDEDK